VQIGRQVIGYLRVSHPWFEVTKPIQQLVFDQPRYGIDAGFRRYEWLVPFRKSNGASVSLTTASSNSQLMLPTN